METQSLIRPWHKLENDQRIDDLFHHRILFFFYPKVVLLFSGSTAAVECQWGGRCRLSRYWYNPGPLDPIPREKDGPEKKRKWWTVHPFVRHWLFISSFVPRFEKWRRNVLIEKMAVVSLSSSCLPCLVASMSVRSSRNYLDSCLLKHKTRQRL